VTRLRQLDKQVIAAGLEAEKCMAWWQGATGVDLQLYAKCIKLICDNPEQFTDQSMIEFFNLPHKHSQAIDAAEHFRQTHLGAIISTRKKYDGLHIIDDFLS
jgi:hypothetical protein